MWEREPPAHRSGGGAPHPSCRHSRAPGARKGWQQRSVAHQAGRPGAHAPAGRSASARSSCGCAMKKKAGRGAARLARAAGRHAPRDA